MNTDKIQQTHISFFFLVKTHKKMYIKATLSLCIKCQYKTEATKNSLQKRKTCQWELCAVVVVAEDYTNIEWTY